jgi:hypothetical protein
MHNQAHVDYFLPKIEGYKKEFKDCLGVAAVSSIDIVNGWDFSDEELLTVLGKKDLKTDDELYAEILRVVRKNPLNQNPVPKGFQRYMRPILHGKL